MPEAGRKVWNCPGRINEQHGVNIIIKSGRNGPEMSPKWTPNGPEMGPKLAPNRPQIGVWTVPVIRDFSPPRGGNFPEFPPGENSRKFPRARGGPGGAPPGGSKMAVFGGPQGAPKSTDFRPISGSVLGPPGSPRWGPPGGHAGPLRGLSWMATAYAMRWRSLSISRVRRESGARWRLRRDVNAMSSRCDAMRSMRCDGNALAMRSDASRWR